MTTEPIMSEDVAAAELALGVLDGEERASALRRTIAEPDFARDVERWRDHFGLLFAGVAEEAAPDGLFAKIEARIDGGRSVEPINAVAATGRSNPWKPAALAASVAALAMTAVALRPVEAPPTLPAAPVAQAATAPMIAAMALTDTNASQPALYDADAGMVRMPGPMPIPEGRSAQLWVIEGDAAPKPLGTFRATGPGAYVAEAKIGAVITPGTKLAITIEPIGGSPTGKPTGPVIASGLLSKV
ncbi:MAG: anti-sigma factor [Sphingomonas bacterium]|nr:anti-sigma factor [Sphingomonas bacterium]